MMSDQPRMALSRRASRAKPQPISEMLAYALSNPQVISLAAGFVDYETLPAPRVGRIVGELLGEARQARVTLQYGTTQGLPELRGAVHRYLASLDDAAPEAYPGSAEDVVITNGSQQLLHLVTDVLVDLDDIVIAAWPDYFVYTSALPGMGAQVRAVEMDEEGLIPDRLDALLAALEKVGQLSRVKIIYACTYHQNPTGATLSEDRRAQLVDIVRRWSRRAGHRIILIEDAAYRELTYAPASAARPRSLKSYDTDNAYVALMHTFSKPFAPGLKIGYGLLPRDLVEPVLVNKGGRDFGTSNLSQRVMLAAMEQGDFAQHIDTLRQAYAAKRDAMLEALDEGLGALGEQVRFSRPAGGLYVWLTLPEAIDTGRDGPLFERAIAHGVLYVPGAYCYPPDPRLPVPTNTIRLSFGTPSVADIRQGIARLSAAIREVLEAGADLAGAQTRR